MMENFGFNLAFHQVQPIWSFIIFIPNTNPPYNEIQLFVYFLLIVRFVF
jgi:hypothetical protein